jgi:hypothetical protein
MGKAIICAIAACLMGTILIVIVFAVFMRAGALKGVGFP